jgi:ATP-dependent helicase HrpB
VLATSRLTYDQLVFSESKADIKPGSPLQADAARILLKEALGLDQARMAGLSAHDWVLALAQVANAEDLEAQLVRISLVARYFPDLGLPDLVQDPARLQPTMIRVLEGKLSLGELKEIDWPSAILTACGDVLPHQLDDLAPTHVALAGGRRVRVQYTLNQYPWIESRLQDFFGMKKGPSILRSRMPLTLHLLAPNKRAVQVTTDLEGFWQRAYPELRHQLSRRYPRHQWPEKP